MGRRTATTAGLIGIALLVVSCGGSNDAAMEAALAQIEMDSDATSTSTATALEQVPVPVTSTTAAPTITAADTATTTSSSTTTSISRAATSTTASSPTTPPIAGIDHPRWNLVCAQDLGATAELDRTSCAPFDPSASVLLSVPAADSLGCAAWLDNPDTYDPDIGTDFYAVIMEPVGDGVGVHVGAWYPEDAAPGDDLAIAWFSPYEIRPDDDEFPSGQYICLTKSDVGWNSIEFSVRQDLDLEDWNPENLITVDVDYTDE